MTVSDFFNYIVFGKNHLIIIEKINNLHRFLENQYEL